jgi:hypothetical protein
MRLGGEAKGLDLNHAAMLRIVFEALVSARLGPLGFLLREEVDQQSQEDDGPAYQGAEPSE